MGSGYPTSTSLLRVDGLLTDPRVLGRHNLYSQIPSCQFIVELVALVPFGYPTNEYNSDFASNLLDDCFNT